MSRDNILHRIRTALGRSAGQPPDDAPPVRLRPAAVDGEARVRLLLDAVATLGGITYRASSAEDARAYIAGVLEKGSAVASNSPLLRESGIATLPNVQSGFTGRDELQAACAAAGFGITGADYALADTGTVVLFSSPEEARLISLLPPVHIAVVAREKILSGLDELLALVPNPTELTSSMVLITGGSRTADIEQVLVRGVHGPGEIHVVVV